MRKLLLVASLVASLSGCATLSVPEQTGRIVAAIQATGALQPGMYNIPGDSHKVQLDNLANWIRSQGFVVDMDGPIDPMICFGCVGATSPTLKMIVIDGEQEINMQYATLLHEGAHMLFLPTKDRRVQEIIAETSAYLAARETGLDTMRQSFSYLADTADPTFREMVLRNFSKDIDEIVKILVKASKG